MHRDKRHAQRERGALGKIHAHQHRADEPRRVGAGHCVDIGADSARLLQRPLRQDGDDLQMAAGRDLRHDAAVHGVQICLGKNLVGQDPAPILHQRDGGLVAGGFHG